MPALASTAGAGTLVVEPWWAHAGSKACTYTTRQGQTQLTPYLTPWMPATQVRVLPHARTLAVAVLRKMPYGARTAKAQPSPALHTMQLCARLPRLSSSARAALL
jgi:hypothetical protein